MVLGLRIIKDLIFIFYPILLSLTKLNLHSNPPIA